jgi:pimeloyl-ACP methyl ester carboxylesterase
VTGYFLAFCLTVAAIPTALAGDQQREQDYANLLQNTPIADQTVWLKSGETQFLGLFLASEKTDNTQAAIIIHDVGDHPDQQPLIHELRSTLPLHNWSTLAVQMPLREVGASAEDYYSLFDQARGRIESAAAYLRSKGAKQVAIIGYGMGAAMASYSVQTNLNTAMAMVFISLPLPESTQPQAKIGDFLRAINLPILDIYAEFDLPEVAASARERKMLAKDNPVYRQIRIDGESHTYLNDPGLVVKRVYSWLALTAAEK